MTRWTTAAKKHRVPNENAAHVIATTTPSATTTKDGTPGFLYLGRDQTGQMLEIITVAIPDDELVIHVMPYRYRRKKKS